jgi:hypothetical protein
MLLMYAFFFPFAIHPARSALPQSAVDTVITQTSAAAKWRGVSHRHLAIYRSGPAQSTQEWNFTYAHISSQTAANPALVTGTTQAAPITTNVNFF